MHTRRQMTAWFECGKRGGPAADRQELASMADLWDSVSLFGEVTAEFVSECRGQGIENYATIFGGEGSFDTAEHRDATVAQCLKLCDELNVDGVDLDFENASPSSRDGYSDLLRRLRSEMNARGRKISICIGYSPALDRYPRGSFFDPAVVGATCDQIRVMCYDIHDGSLAGKPENDTETSLVGFGPVVSWPWVRAAMSFWLRYAPADHIVMALPTWGMDYDLTKGSVSKSPVAPAQQTVRRYWLWYLGMHACTYNDDNGNLHLRYETDVRSTLGHLATADEMGIPTIAFWGALNGEMLNMLRDWKCGKPVLPSLVEYSGGTQPTVEI